MHSEIATRLENMKLLKYLTQTDGEGIQMCIRDRFTATPKIDLI